MHCLSSGKVTPKDAWHNDSESVGSTAPPSPAWSWRPSKVQTKWADVEDSDNEITLATDMVSRAASGPSTNVHAQSQRQSRLPSRRWADMEDSDDETHMQATLHLPTSVE